MRLKLILILLITGLMVMSCDLDELGIEIPEIPEAAEAPDFSKIEMKTGVFADEQAKAEIVADNAIQYLVAASIVNVLDSQLALVTSTLSDFMDPIATSEPEFKDGIFTWDYTVNSDLFMTSLDVTLRAFGLRSVSWSALVSGTVFGNELDDVEVIKGTTSVTGETGNMELSVFVPEEEEEFLMTIDWILNDETLTNLTFSLSNPALDGPSFIEVTYTLEGTTAQIVGETTSSEGSVVYTVIWDIETGVGSLNTPDLGTLCWDADKQAADC